MKYGIYSKILISFFSTPLCFFFSGLFFPFFMLTCAAYLIKYFSEINLKNK